MNRDDTAWIQPGTVLPDDVSIGFCSRVGHETEGDFTQIGQRVRIGAFCMIAGGVELGDEVEVDHYCLVGWGVRVGAKSRILYKAHVYDEVKIGKNCIIGGDLVDRTIVGDNVTFQGTTAHAHADPNGDWEETVEPSPIILNGSVVGVGAIIVGGITIGPRAYVAAGERVTCDVPREMVVKDGELKSLAEFRGIIKVRDE